MCLMLTTCMTCGDTTYKIRYNPPDISVFSITSELPKVIHQVIHTRRQLMYSINKLSQWNTPCQKYKENIRFDVQVIIFKHYSMCTFCIWMKWTLGPMAVCASHIAVKISCFSELWFAIELDYFISLSQ